MCVTPDVSVLSDIKAVEVRFILLGGAGGGQTLDDLGLQLHGDVPRQDRQQEVLLDTRVHRVKSKTG